MNDMEVVSIQKASVEILGTPLYQTSEMILLYLEDPRVATDVSYLTERACCISQDVWQINDFSCLRKGSRVVDRPHSFNRLKKHLII